MASITSLAASRPLHFRLSSAVIGAGLMLLPLNAQAEKLKTLYGFAAEPDGAKPVGGPVFVKGTLFGTTNSGGVTDQGTIYTIDPKSGAETVLHSFAGGADGVAPEGDLIAHGGILYGTTSFGGTFNSGTVFSFDTATGIETIIYSFGAGTDGTLPAAGLLYLKGVLYGTTTSGGESGNGVVFAVNARTGVEAVLHGFAGGTDGAVPFAGLTQLGGALYGVTYFGGASNNGTVYRIDPATGSETVIYAFKGKSFEGNPAATMVANNGLLYGTTAHGGLRKCHGSGCGTVFAIDPATGNETKLYSFDGFRDGQDPEGAMAVLGGSLYGATLEGGRSELGTIFKIDLATGTETVLHDFEKATDGSNPGTLIYHAGHLFGTTAGESAAGFGTVFTLKP